MPVTSLRLSIADHPVELCLPDEGIIEEARKRYSGFLTTREPLTRFVITLPERLRDVVDAGIPWARCGTADVAFGRNDFLARTDDSLHEIHVEMRNLVYTVDALLRVFYSVFLIQHGGVLLHAASVGVDGDGLLFPGPTESGKSELSHMGQGTHLTDELTPVRPSDDAYVIYGSPFWGLFEQGGHNIGLPLRSVFFLTRGDTALRRLSRMQALQRLLRCVLNFSREPSVTEQVVTTCGSILARSPYTGLESPPDPELWPLVHAFRRDHTTGMAADH